MLFFFNIHENHPNVFFLFFLSSWHSFYLARDGEGAGDHFGIIWGPFGDYFYSFFSLKNMEIIKHMFVSIFLPRGSFVLPSRGCGGGRGTILGSFLQLY